MLRHLSKLNPVLAALSLAVPAIAQATNGMDMEGYGPVATAMGGASMAYNNGTAAMMNNPATIGMMAEGTRLDLAFGFLGPDVEVSAAGQNLESDGTAYFMPAVGWAQKSGRLSYGLGLYGQGGMGTEYDASSFLGNPAAPAGVQSNLNNRTELSVGRVILPVTYDVNERLVLGGSLDFVWAGLDLRMAMSEAAFLDLATPGVQTIGTAGGSLLTAFTSLYSPGNPVVGQPDVQRINHAAFDYSNGSRFSGEAKATGFAGKLGAVFKINDKLSVGAAYHSETSLGDIKTDNAKIRMGINTDMLSEGTYQDIEIPVTGDIAVKDFQWPATYAVGLAYQASDDLMLAADIKHIDWSSTMQSFVMEFRAHQNQANPLAAGFGGTTLDTELFQRWDDQKVYSIGGAYDVNEQLTLRAGFNYAANPVPGQYLNALFPATVEKHITAGFGYHFSEDRFLDFSIQRGLSADLRNPGNGSTIPALDSAHAQVSWQVIYTLLF